MIFHEMYGVYYQTVAEILTEALNTSISKERINEIVRRKAFEESILTIPDSLGSDNWMLLNDNGTAVIDNPPYLPVTLLEKRWINAIANDPRIRLFIDNPFVYPDVEPLYRQEDIYIFDKYSDGDPFKDEGYIRRFRLILDAIKDEYPIRVVVNRFEGDPVEIITIPKYLEYSEKDDKFRMIGAGGEYGNTINLGRIISCERYADEIPPDFGQNIQSRPRTVTMELVDERNTLERAMMNFAHYKKKVEKVDDSKYLITLDYENADTIEVLIRILSFGPNVRVIEPESFVNLIKKRLIMQRKKL